MAKKEIKPPLKKEVFGYLVGDEVINIDHSSSNYKRVGLVIGFHRSDQFIYVKYLDGTFGGDYMNEAQKTYFLTKNIIRK